MSWIKCSDQMPTYGEEVVVHVLLKDDELMYWMPASYHQLLKKAWWIPQREAFVVDGIEDALHLITHWQPLPEPPEN